MKDHQLRKEVEIIKRLLFRETNIDLIGLKSISMGDINLKFIEIKNIINSLHPCSTCKALFRIEDLQRVFDKACKENCTTGTPFHYEGQDFFYCPSHKVPHDRIQDGKYYKDNVEVFPVSVGKFKNIRKKESFRWDKNVVKNLKAEIIKNK